MVEVDWTLALGDQSLSEDELVELANSKSNLVQIKGEWINIDKEQAEAALEELQKRRKNDEYLTPTDLLRITAELGAEDTNTDFDTATFSPQTQSADDWLAKLIEGLPDDDLTEENESERFNGALRPYQRRALSWLQFLGRLGLGGCLADDMGLGKTPTALAHIQSRHSDKPTLVICPLSVVVMLKDTLAVAAVLERGTYPIFLARETTFSLKVAESEKDSLTIMLELNAVM